MNDHNGINAQHFTGFVGKTIITYESKQGAPAIRFIMWVGDKRPNGFWQWVAVYGNRSIELARNMGEGDLMMVYGKKAFLNFTASSGKPSYTDFCVAGHCYIMAKASTFKKEE